MQGKPGMLSRIGQELRRGNLIRKLNAGNVNSMDDEEEMHRGVLGSGKAWM